jgi:hypothetical protein
MTKGPLEGLGENDVETPVFSGEPSTYCGTFGAQGDADMAIWRKGERQRFPPGVHYRAVARKLQANIAAADSPDGEATRLRLIGETRSIERYPGETDAGYCERLAAAFPTWQSAGTPNAIIRQLNAFGLPDVLVFEEYEYYITTADSYGWKFVVVIGPDYGALGWVPLLLGSWTLGEDSLGITNLQPLQVDALKRIVLKWKQVFSYPLRIVFLFDDATPLGLAVLGQMVLGGGSLAVASMGEVHELGKMRLGDPMGLGFNT